jgi:hypothetical protein
VLETLLFQTHHFKFDLLKNQTTGLRVGIEADGSENQRGSMIDSSLKK